MAKIMSEDGYREMTLEEESFLFSEEQVEQSQPDALTEMVTAMSTATTLAQMRSACKTFLEKTEVQNI